MTSVSAGHIILTPTQPVGSGRPLRESNPGPPTTELPCPPERERDKERWILNEGGSYKAFEKIEKDLWERGEGIRISREKNTRANTKRRR